MRSLFTALFSIGLSGAAAAQASPPVEQFLTPSIRQWVAAYSRCAVQHLTGLARVDPSKTFEAVEASLKPACGSFYDQVRSELQATGYSTGQVNWIIGQTYLANEQGYRAAYQGEVLAEYQRREAQRQAELQRQRDEQLKAERNKQLEVATQGHLACLRQQMKEIVLYSTEPAETLSSVLMTKCSEGERKRAELIALINNVPSSQLYQVRNFVGSETKKFVLAEIVTLRAALNKVIIENTRPDAPATPKKADADL